MNKELKAAEEESKTCASKSDCVIIITVIVVMVVIVVIVVVTIIVIACDKGCLQHAKYNVQFMHHNSVVIVRWSVHLFLALLSRCLSNHPLFPTTFWHMYLWEVLLWHALHVANPQFYCS